MRFGVVATILLSFVAAGVSGASEDKPSPWVEKSFVILKSTGRYEEALSFLKSAEARLNVKVDLRGLAPNATRGLTLPKSRCEEEWGEFPCYFPRGRWDDGVYLSIEHSSGYKGFTPGLHIVVLASGSRASDQLRAARDLARGVYPDAYLKTTPVYLGCMH